MINFNVHYRTFGHDKTEPARDGAMLVQAKSPAAARQELIGKLSTDDVDTIHIKKVKVAR